MKLYRNSWVLLAVLGVAGAACSGGSETSGDDDAGQAGSGANGGSSGASGGSTATGGAGGSTGGSTATGGSGGTTGGSANGGSAGSTGGSAGSAGSGAVDCTGTFGTPELLFTAETGESAQSLSITGDDLELFYEVESDTSGPRIEVRKRTSRTATFGPPTILPAELLGICSGANGPSLDVSDDGLRLYLTCVDTTGEVIVPGPIRVAERASRVTTDFKLRPDTYGQGGVSISVSADELTAFWSDYADRSSPKPVTATRMAVADSFGAPSGPPGAAQDVLRHPEISSDLRNLFGALAGETGFSHLVVYTRPSSTATFRAASTEGLPTPPSAAGDPIEDLSPTLSADCRSLYFLRYTHSDPTVFDVYGARR